MSACIEALAMAGADYMECNIKMKDLEPWWTALLLKLEAFIKDMSFFSSQSNFYNQSPYPYRLSKNFYKRKQISSGYAYVFAYDDYLYAVPKKVGIKKVWDEKPKTSRSIKSIGNSIVRTLKSIFNKLYGLFLV